MNDSTQTPASPDPLGLAVCLLKRVGIPVDVQRIHPLVWV